MKTVLHTTSYKNHLFPTALDDCQFQRFVRDPARGSDQHFGLLTDDGRSQSWYRRMEKEKIKQILHFPN